MALTARIIEFIAANRIKATPLARFQAFWLENSA
jgi:hypothetical protein